MFEGQFEGVARAFGAACAPFGSLTQGVDPAELSAAILAFLDAKVEEQPERMAPVARPLFGYYQHMVVLGCERPDSATAEFEPFGVTLRTPTSGTAIRIRKYPDGRGRDPYHPTHSFSLEVDFGRESAFCSLLILEAAEGKRVQFEVFLGEKRVPREEVLRGLIGFLSERLEGLEREEVREDLIASSTAMRSSLQASLERISGSSGDEFE
jgi:hypothetical protein